MTAIKQHIDPEVTPDQEKKVGHTYMQWISTVLVATTLLNYGLQGGWVSPMKKVLQSENSPSGVPMSDAVMSWLASLTPLAGGFGTFLYTYITDTYGRKIGIIAVIAPQALCWIIKLTSTHAAALLIARICAGIPAGGCFNVVPMYVKEISQDNLRGPFVALSMSFIYVGYLSMYAIGSYLDYYLVLWIGLSVPIAAGILVILIAPESPAFLVKQGKLEVAAKTVAMLRGLDTDHKIVQEEMEYMKSQDAHYKSMKKLTYITILKNKAWRRGFFLCMFNVTMVNFNGTLCMTVYALTIMMEAGVTSNPELQTFSIPIIMIFGSLVSMACVERLGRKPIMVGGFILSTVALSCLATAQLVKSVGDVTVPGWVPVVAIGVSTFSYSASTMPTTYVILSEIFIFEVRAKLIGVMVSFAWFMGFLQTYTYLPISNTFGMYTTFYMFAAVNLIGAIFSVIFLSETRGKTIEEIEQILVGKKAH